MNPTNKFTSSRLYCLLASSRKARILSASALLMTICAFGAVAVAPLAPDASDLPVTLLAEDLELPNLGAQIAALQQNEKTYNHEEKIRSGDTLAAMLTRLGVDDSAAASFIKTDKVAHGVMQLTPGNQIQAQTAENGQLQWLRTTMLDGKDKPVKNIFLKRKGTSFVATEAPAQLERRVEMLNRSITSTLFAATESSSDGRKLPDSISAQIIAMFSTNIDFHADLKRGDHFNVVYESFWQDGEMIKAGRVLAGEFTSHNRTYQSVWFDDPSSKLGGGYYSFDGKSLQKAFLKSPIQFSRISSGFSMRVHPISGQWKQHKGIDFAAAAGTPIHASGDGVVESLGFQNNGYGNLVVLKHWANYSSAYAHMSRFAPGIKKGDKVHQGDVIGFVGTTGWATGAHLHYEFRVGNEARDPATENMIAQTPLSTGELKRFHSVSNDMMHRFALLTPATGLKLAAR